MNKGLWVVLSVSLLAQRAHAQDSAVPAPAGRFVIEVEAGPVWQSRNDVQIPNESGTRISLVDLIGAGPNLAYRVSGIWEISRRHSIRLLVAPLTISGDGVLTAPVEFAGSSFLQDVTTEVTYRFNSYRLTYRYRLRDGVRWSWQLGFTAKIRDAKVELRHPGAAARDYNIGFVPLLHFTGRLQLAPRWQLQGEVDALAAPQGRAEDAALKLSYSPSDAWNLAVGYRTLEGGADVDEVFTFAWLHYGVLSVKFRI